MGRKKKVNDYLGFEDEFLINYVISLLENKSENLDPKKMQMLLMNFLDKHTAFFMKELWKLLLSSQKSENGIPLEILKERQEEMKMKNEKKLSLMKLLEKLIDFKDENTLKMNKNCEITKPEEASFDNDQMIKNIEKIIKKDNNPNKNEDKPYKRIIKSYTSNSKSDKKRPSRHSSDTSKSKSRSRSRSRHQYKKYKNDMPKKLTKKKEMIIIIKHQIMICLLEQKLFVLLSIKIRLSLMIIFKHSKTFL